MATGYGAPSAQNTHLVGVREPGVKRLKKDPTGKGCLVTQPGSIQGLEEGTALECVKQEPAEEQECEALWQPFLKVMETPSSEGGHLGLPGQQGHASCSWSPLDASQQPRGHEVPQHLFGSKESRRPDATSLATDKTGCRTVKAEFPDEVVHEEVILGEDAASWDAKRQRFRQFCYYETMGPRMVSHRLWTLCREWLQPEKRTKEQILELVILEQFLAILPPDMQSWVKQHCPDSCPRAVCLAEGFLMVQKQKESGVLQKDGVNLHPAGQPLLGTCQGPLFRELKQEDNSNPIRPGGGTVSEIKEQDLSQKESLMEAPEMAEGIAQQTVVPLSESALLRPPKEEPGTICNPEGGETAREIKEKDLSQEESLTGARGMAEGRGQWSIASPKEEPGAVYSPGANFCSDSFSAANNKMAAEENEEKPGKSEPEAHRPVSDREEETTGASGQMLTEEREEVWTGYGKTFRWKSYLTPCKETLVDTRIYRCCTCGKRCDSSSILAHQKMHTGKKLYECIYCGKTFNQRAHFDNHEKIHTEVRARVHASENLYICSTCGKSFACFSTLVAHKRSHGEDDISTTD